LTFHRLRRCKAKYITDYITFFADCQEFFEIAVEFISAFSAKKNWLSAAIHILHSRRESRNSATGKTDRDFTKKCRSIAGIF